MKNKMKAIIGIAGVIAIIGLAIACNNETVHSCSFGEWETKTSATCVAKETQERTCSSCVKTETREIGEFDLINGHDMEVSGEVTKAATCTEDGIGKKECSICDYTEPYGVLEKLGHSFIDNWSETRPATCTVENQETRTCTLDCGETGHTETRSTIAALGHTFTVWGNSTATCTVAGTETRTCTLACDLTGHTETRNVSALGHSFTTWGETRPATCTVENQETRTCTVDCGETGHTETQSTIAALGHDFTVWGNSTATCTTAGTETRTCTLACDLTGYTETRPAEALGHSFTDWNETRAATCTVENQQTRTCTRTCGLDGHTETRSTVEELGHDWINNWTKKTDRTCTAAQIDERECNRAGCTEKQERDSPTVGALGHTFNNWGLTLTRECTRDNCNHTQTGAPPTTWTAVTQNALIQNIGGITYGNNRFIAFSGANMAWSQNGETWTAVNSLFNIFGFDNIQGITYGNDRFVAVGGSGIMAWSTNGTTWTAVTAGTGTIDITDPGNSTFGANSIRGITYGNDRFVAVGQQGRMAWSTNGETWTAVTGGTGTGSGNLADPGNSTFGANQINGIAFGNGTFVAVGNSGRMAWSTDGVTWTAVTAADNTFNVLNSNAIRGITYGNGRFVAIGQHGRMAWSTNGTTWTAVTPGTGTATITDPGNSTFGQNGINGITYGNGRFVAAGDNGRMAWSEDGENWTAVTGGTGTTTITDPGNSTFGANYISGITYGNGRFVAVGFGPRMAWHEVMPE